MLPFMPKLAGPILCCFKFNQDIIYLGYDVSRVVVHWSKPEPVRLLQTLQMFPVPKTKEHSKCLSLLEFLYMGKHFSDKSCPTLFKNIFSHYESLHLIKK